MYWTKNGSIPSETTDGTEGWQPAPAPPTDIPEGHELLWASWQWHILPPKPTEAGLWRWYIDRGWVKREEKVVELTAEQVEVLATQQIVDLATQQIVDLTSSQVTYG